MDVEELGVEEGREERVLGPAAILLLYPQKDLLVHLILVYVPSGGQEGLDGGHFALARQQPEEVVADVAVHFGDDLPGQLFIAAEAEFQTLLLQEREEGGRWEVALHLFEPRNESISQPG